MGSRVMLPGWEGELARLTAQRRMQWDWSTLNCALWAADVVRAITGRDYAADWRVLPNDGCAIMKQVDNAGGLSACVTASVGEPMPVNQAQRGDLVLHAGIGGEALGVCIGDRIAFLGRRGVMHRPLRDGIMAWSVR